MIRWMMRTCWSLLIVPIFYTAPLTSADLKNPNFKKEVIYRWFTDPCVESTGTKNDAIQAFDGYCKNLNLKALSKEPEHLKEMNWEVKSTSQGCTTDTKKPCKQKICAKKIWCIE